MYIDPNDAGGLAFFGMACGSLIALAVYIVPSAVALKRQHPNSMAIVAVNILLGWTVLGWIGALVWSLTRKQ